MQNQYNKGQGYNAAPGKDQASGYPAAVPPELFAEIERGKQEQVIRIIINLIGETSLRWIPAEVPYAKGQDDQAGLRGQGVLHRFYSAITHGAFRCCCVRERE